MSDGHSFKKSNREIDPDQAKSQLKEMRTQRKFLEGRAKEFGRVVKRRHHTLNQGPDAFPVTGDNWEMFENLNPQSTEEIMIDAYDERDIARTINAEKMNEYRNMKQFVAAHKHYAKYIHDQLVALKKEEEMLNEKN